VTADLEALILPDGQNQVYMASWYNGETYKIFDITKWEYNTNTMLEMFWNDLITNNIERNCYFHNFGGYDAILSLSALLNLPYTFKPLVKDGEILSIQIINSNKEVILTIKDSIKILPASLAKLAKDWKVETQKDHFPHYFFLDTIKNTLNYEGYLPAYNYFEPKRTSLSDYNEMVAIFKDKSWSFLEVSKSYILGDVKALYQILIKFFETFHAKFPINPLEVLSAPSTAFKIWRTVQLPRLNSHILGRDAGLKVYDLSMSLDSTLRPTYFGLNKEIGRQIRIS
jgi:hypothetical protein